MKPIASFLIILLTSCSSIRESQVPKEAKPVHLQLVRKDCKSSAFYSEGYKLNESYWHTNRNGKSYLLPESWRVYSFIELTGKN